MTQVKDIGRTHSHQSGDRDPLVSLAQALGVGCPKAVSLPQFRPDAGTWGEGRTNVPTGSCMCVIGVWCTMPYHGEVNTPECPVLLDPGSE